MPEPQPSRAFPAATVAGERGWIAGVWLWMAVAVALRLPGCLDAWPNPDEGIYLKGAVVPSWTVFADLVRSNAHPPLYYVLHRVLASVGEHIVALRLLALVSGVLAVHAVARLAREAFDPATGFVAAGALALAPGAVALSQVARPYSFTLMVAAYGVTALLVHLRSGSARALAWHAVAMGVLVMTHYGAWPIVAACGVALLLDTLGSERRSLWPRRLAALGVPFGLAVALTLFHLVPHVVGSTMQRSAQTNWLQPYFAVSAADAWLGIVGVERYLFGERGDGVAALSALLGFLLLCARGRTAMTTVVGVALVVWFALSWFGQLPFGSTRHSFQANALLVPLVAAPLGWALGRGPAVALLAVLMVSGALWSPALPRALSGAAGLTTPVPVERVASAEAIRPQLAFLEPLRRRAAIVVMDRQTYSFLAPIWVEAGVFPLEKQGDVSSAFAWGTSRIAVSHAWTLRAGAQGLQSPQHLHRFLHRIDAAHPDWRIFENRSGWWVSGGWHADVADEIGAGDAALAHGGSGSVRQIVAKEGLVRARVDWRRYEKLAEREIARARREAEGGFKPEASDPSS